MHPEVREFAPYTGGEKVDHDSAGGFLSRTAIHPGPDRVSLWVGNRRGEAIRADRSRSFVVISDQFTRTIRGKRRTTIADGTTW
jgi:hypothetical protein